MKRARTPAASDTGTFERYRHGDTIVIGGLGRGGVKRAYVVTQSPVERYRIRGLLGDGREARNRVTAAQTLWVAFYQAGLSSRLTGNYEAAIGGGSTEGFRVICLDAYDFYMNLRDSIRIEAVPVVYDVVCQWEPAGNSRRLQALRAGLDDVAQAIGLK